LALTVDQPTSSARLGSGMWENQVDAWNNRRLQDKYIFSSIQRAYEYAASRTDVARLFLLWL
jgi:hypothetical protein